MPVTFQLPSRLCKRFNSRNASRNVYFTKKVRLNVSIEHLGYLHSLVRQTETQMWGGRSVLTTTYDNVSFNCLQFHDFTQIFLRVGFSCTPNDFVTITENNHRSILASNQQFSPQTVFTPVIYPSSLCHTHFSGWLSTFQRWHRWNWSKPRTLLDACIFYVTSLEDSAEMSKQDDFI